MKKISSFFRLEKKLKMPTKSTSENCDFLDRKQGYLHHFANGWWDGMQGCLQGEGGLPQIADK